MGSKSDIQFKNDLRKELITFERLLKLAQGDKKDELIEAIQDEIKRINASLQD